MRTQLALALLTLPALVGGCGDDEPSRSSKTTTADCSGFDITETEPATNVHIVTVGSRFSICLDENQYPLSGLVVDDECPFGDVSNLSINGPEHYPIGFEVTEVGSCEVRNGDFEVAVVASG